MPVTNRSLGELAALGAEVFDKQVRPTLRSEDDGKFVAIDIDTGDFEVDTDDYLAVSRLKSRKPAADVWLVRAGFPTTCRIGAIR